MEVPTQLEEKPVYDEEYTTVKVELEMDGQSVRLTPADDVARQTMRVIVEHAPDSLYWHFQGVSRNEDGDIVKARFACGGTRYERRGGNSTTIDYRGSVKVAFDLSETDRIAAHTMRNFGYYSGVVVDSSATEDLFILNPAQGCKLCGGSLGRRIELEWQVCADCAAKCEHVFVEGVGQANGHLAYLPFCEKCGRGDPEWKPNDDPMFDMLNVVANGGVAVLILENPDGTFTLITKE